VENITNRLNHTEKRIPEIEDKIEDILHCDKNKEKNMNTIFKNSGT
jgi:hypothetical protein